VSSQLRTHEASPLRLSSYRQSAYCKSVVLTLSAVTGLFFSVSFYDSI